MAKYTSTGIINAAQWNPEDPEEARAFLADLKKNVKKCQLVQTIPVSKLGEEGILAMTNPDLIIDYSSGGVVTAKPTDYVVESTKTKLKVMGAASFERQYQLSPEPDPGESPASPAEKSSLNELLTAASTAAVTANVSIDGSEYLETEKWVTQEALDTLKIALFDAHITSHDKNATVTEVNAAIDELTKAIDAFNAALQDGTKEPDEEPENPTPAPDKTTLTGAIAAATAAKIGATVSVDGSEVEPEDTWVEQDAVTALETAIAAAQTVVDKEDASQDEIDGAIEALNEAVDTFKNSQKAGTKQPAVTVNKTALTTAIGAAEAIISDAVVSEDGTDVLTTASWVKQEDVDTLQTAIDAAKVVANNEEATAEDVADAVEDLNEALSAYNAAKKDGTKTLITKEDLQTLVTAAQTKRDDIEVSEDGSDVIPEDQWTTGAAFSALNAAITAATGVAEDADATQDEIDEAYSTLEEAIATFEGTLQDGTKTLVEEDPVDKSSLELAIANAITAKEGVVVASNAGEVMTDKFWVTQADMDELDEAINTAQATVDNADATADDVEAAITAINEAVSTFEDAMQQGQNGGIDEGEVNLED